MEFDKTLRNQKNPNQRGAKFKNKKTRPSSMRDYNPNRQEHYPGSKRGKRGENNLFEDLESEKKIVIKSEKSPPSRHHSSRKEETSPSDELHSLSPHEPSENSEDDNSEEYGGSEDDNSEDDNSEEYSSEDDNSEDDDSEDDDSEEYRSEDDNSEGEPRSFESDDSSTEENFSEESKNFLAPPSSFNHKEEEKKGDSPPPSTFSSLSQKQTFSSQEEISLKEAQSPVGKNKTSEENPPPSVEVAFLSQEQTSADSQENVLASLSSVVVSEEKSSVSEEKSSVSEEKSSVSEEKSSVSEEQLPDLSSLLETMNVPPEAFSSEEGVSDSASIPLEESLSASEEVSSSFSKKPEESLEKSFSSSLVQEIVKESPSVLDSEKGAEKVSLIPKDLPQKLEEPSATMKGEERDLIPNRKRYREHSRREISFSPLPQEQQQEPSLSSGEKGNASVASSPLNQVPSEARASSHQGTSALEVQRTSKNLPQKLGQEVHLEELIHKRLFEGINPKKQGRGVATREPSRSEEKLESALKDSTQIQKKDSGVVSFRPRSDETSKGTLAAKLANNKSTESDGGGESTSFAEGLGISSEKVPEKTVSGKVRDFTKKKKTPVVSEAASPQPFGSGLIETLPEEEIEEKLKEFEEVEEKEVSSVEEVDSEEEEILERFEDDTLDYDIHSLVHSLDGGIATPPLKPEKKEEPPVVTEAPSKYLPSPQDLGNDRDSRSSSRYPEKNQRNYSSQKDQRYRKGRYEDQLRSEQRPDPQSQQQQRSSVATNPNNGTSSSSSSPDRYARNGSSSRSNRPPYPKKYPEKEGRGTPVSSYEHSRNYRRDREEKEQGVSRIETRTEKEQKLVVSPPSAFRMDLSLNETRRWFFLFCLLLCFVFVFTLLRGGGVLSQPSYRHFLYQWRKFPSVWRL
jgi:hypothetical protein